MSALTIQCRFIAHSYTGVRHGADGREELDWPPAPARLHQAFISSTLVNLPASERAAFSDRTLDALRWLECLPPPEMIASKLSDDNDHRRALLVAMPHNSPAKTDFSRYHPDLAPVQHAMPEQGIGLSVTYRWENESPDFYQNAELHLPALREAAAKLRYLGRAEDRVECEVLWQAGENQNSPSDSFELWRPTNQTEDITLLIPRRDSTEGLLAEFRRSETRIARGAKRPARIFLQAQGYSRNAAEGILPVHIAIFQILRDTANPDQLPEVCDATNAHRWRSPLRALACKIAKEVDRWNNHLLAAELISGHHPSGGHTRQPHLAFVPLPSISFGGKADGRVRRFALLGYANPENASAAASIYRTLAASLDGDIIEPDFRLQLISDPRRDKVWSLYTRASRSWVSVTPLVITRGFKVPAYASDGTPLSTNERHLRRQDEWVKLARASLRDIRIPADLMETCKILLTPSPLLPESERAERYRPTDERAPFVHARIEFERPVRGPLLLGDRRYLGLGLFAPISLGH